MTRSLRPNTAIHLQLSHSRILCSHPISLPDHLTYFLIIPIGSRGKVWAAGARQFSISGCFFTLHKEDTEHTVIHEEGGKIRKIRISPDLKGELCQKGFFIFLLKAFKCPMCLGFFLPCHSGTAFLFNCSIFSNCRDHNFKLNISNVSWRVSCAGFSLPWFSNPIPPSTPSPPPTLFGS